MIEIIMIAGKKINRVFLNKRLKISNENYHIIRRYISFVLKISLFEKGTFLLIWTLRHNFRLILQLC